MKIQIDQKEFERFIEYEQIKKRIRLIGIEINVAYEGRKPLFLAVLNGSFMFLGDLMKQIEVASEVSFIKLKSYNGTSRDEQIREMIGLDVSLRGREVIIVEDIIDSGNSLNHTLNLVKAQQPASVAVCTLLLKPDAVQHRFNNLAYIGFEIKNEFVVGYGLDYNGLGRNFRDIYKESSSQ
ncbi:hypoxanthine phosphoribosyltransferase [bacterium A37T11]|nr:hypoxanthine phosphoribosyltransferase [bacterium A37T11]